MNNGLGRLNTGKFDKGVGQAHRSALAKVEFALQYRSELKRVDKKDKLIPAAESFLSTLRRCESLNP